MKTHFVLTLLVCVLWLLSCENHDNTTQALIVSPGNGETNVALNKSTILTFSNPVQSSALQTNFHMMTTQKMQGIADSTIYYMGTMGMMGMMTHSDSAIIYNGMMRMMNNHAMHGTFSWNSDSTQCTFDPDSLMMTNTQYGVHVGREMMTMVGMMQGSGMMTDANHGMMGNAGGMMTGDMLITFTTGN